MRPILSIFSALIVSILLLLCMTYLSLSFNIYLEGFPFFAVIFLGGIIATWFSTKNKTRYSIYYGVIFAVIYGFFSAKLLIALILIPLLATMGGSIAKNEKNTIKNLINNKFQGNYKNFFIDLYKRNKIVLMASLIIFFASVVIGGAGPYLSGSFNQFITNLMINYLSNLTHLTNVNTLSIFLNNSNIAFLYMYIGSIFFGISSIIELIFIGLFNGFTFVKYPFTLFYLLPHGIFEVSSYIIAAAAGFKLLSTVMNIIWKGIHIKRDNPIGEQVNKILSINYLKFRDSLTLIVIAIILLIIAAIIEVNISKALGNYITGLDIHSFSKYMLNLINH